MIYDSCSGFWLLIFSYILNISYLLIIHSPAVSGAHLSIYLFLCPPHLYCSVFIIRSINSCLSYFFRKNRKGDSGMILFFIYLLLFLFLQHEHRPCGVGGVHSKPGSFPFFLLLSDEISFQHDIIPVFLSFC